MKKILLLLFISGMCLLGKAQEKITYFSCDFESGIPDKFSTFDLDSLKPASKMSSVGFKDGISWITTQMSSSDLNVFAASSSLHQENTELKPTSDWLITPSIFIKSADALLTWRAIVCDNSTLRDGYNVYISTTGNRPEDFTEEPVFSIPEEENTKWTERSVPLDKYVGKNIYIAFVNNSIEKYILGIDDISVTGSEGLANFSVDTDTHLIDVTKFPVQCTLTVTTDTPITEFVATCTYENQTLTVEYKDLNLQKGEEFTFKFEQEIPIALSDTIKYSVTLLANKEFTQTIDSYSTCFAFLPERKIVFEEGTGMWCGYCPMGTVAIEKMIQKYPDSFIAIAVHTNDPLEVADYTELNFDAYPTGIINRLHKLKPMVQRGTNSKDSYYTIGQGGVETFYLNEINKISPASIEINAAYIEQDKLIEIECSTNFAIKLPGKNYRLAFVMIENEVQKDSYYQYNNYAGSSADMGGFEKKKQKISGNEIHFNEVARCIAENTKDLEGSIPDEISPNVPYVYTYTMETPETIINPNNTELIALLIDQQTGEIINADKTHLISTSIQSKSIQDIILAGAILQGECTVQLNVPEAGALNISVSDMNGRILNTYKGYSQAGSQVFRFPCQVVSPGIYFLHIQTGKNEQYIKVCVTK